MIGILSITGLFRTALILIGIFVILRFFRQFMQNKTNAANERKEELERKAFENERKEKQQNLGKTKIVQNARKDSNVQDVDFDEV